VTPLSKGTRLITCNSAICDTCTRCLHYKPHTISIPLLLQPHGIEPELYDFNRTVVSEDGVLSRSHY
jgi:hypothetical protein